MEFEYDPAKSQANREKHGIDFDAAQEMWRYGDLIWGPSKHPVEDRFMAIGRIKRQIWAAVYTMRQNRIRLISVRPAKRKERAIYVRASGQSTPDDV